MAPKEQEEMTAKRRARTFAGKRTDVGLIKGAIGYDFTKWNEHTIGRNKGSGKKKYRSFS